MPVTTQTSLGAQQGLRVSGLDELNRALRRASKDVRVGVRKELRKVAEPVRVDAARLAREEIRRIGPRWWRMRVGLALADNVIYVAPSQRGVKSGGDRKRKRPNLANLLMDRAMEPALEAHADEIEDRFGAMLDAVSDGFSL